MVALAFRTSERTTVSNRFTRLSKLSVTNSALWVGSLSWRFPFPQDQNSSPKDGCSSRMTLIPLRFFHYQIPQNSSPFIRALYEFTYILLLLLRTGWVMDFSCSVDHFLRFATTLPRRVFLDALRGSFAPAWICDGLGKVLSRRNLHSFTLVFRF